MAMESSGDTGVEERYLCPICREVFHHPVYPACKHTFCKRCLDQLPPSSASGALSCPVCRLSFLHSDLERHMTLEQEMTRTSLMCTTCHEKCKLSHWRAHSSTHPQAPALIPPPHLAQQHNRPPPPPNRATFSCPLCAQGNLTTSDLLTHVNTLHPNSRAAVVCPICAAMPWGEPDRTSQNFIRHLNMRHKFEYETFVNYDEDEEAVLQATLRASLTDK